MDQNFDKSTVRSFGDEWVKYDQSTLSIEEQRRIFDGYFDIFPWNLVTKDAQGFDMGCGTGRWAELFAPHVSKLNCIDASVEALSVAKERLKHLDNITFSVASVDSTDQVDDSQDFGYSLGVLHHVPNTEAAINSCVALLKPGAPLLLYLYYRFDNRSVWYFGLWKISDYFRRFIIRCPSRIKPIITDVLALSIYWPISRISRFAEILGVKTDWMPLYFYRNKSIYTLRTDSRDRFGTPLEQRFTKVEIMTMMLGAGLQDIVFSENEPYWCAVGIKGPA